MVLVMAVLALIKCFVFTNVTLNAACKYHDKMFRKVMSLFTPICNKQLVNLPTRCYLSVIDHVLSYEFLRLNANWAHSKPLCQRPRGDRQCASQPPRPFLSILSSGHLYPYHHCINLPMDPVGCAYYWNFVYCHPLVSLQVHISYLEMYISHQMRVHNFIYIPVYFKRVFAR